VGGIGGPELLIVFVVILLIFGPKKIPEVARGIGKGFRELRRLNTEFQREINLADVSTDLERSGRPKGPSPGAFSRPSPAPGSLEDSEEPKGSSETRAPEEPKGSSETKASEEPPSPPETGQSES